MRIPITDDFSAASLITDGWYQAEILMHYAGERPDDFFDQVISQPIMPYFVVPAIKKYAAGIAALPPNIHSRIFRDAIMDINTADKMRRAQMVQAITDCDSYVAILPDCSVIGFIALRIHKGADADFDHAQIAFITVSEDYRRVGVGNALLMEAFRQHKIVTAGTQTSNMAARKFYEKHGMSCVTYVRSFHKWL